MKKRKYIPVHKVKTKCKAFANVLESVMGMFCMIDILQEHLYWNWIFEVTDVSKFFFFKLDHCLLSPNHSIKIIVDKIVCPVSDKM